MLSLIRMVITKQLVDMKYTFIAFGSMRYLEVIELFQGENTNEADPNQHQRNVRQP